VGYWVSWGMERARIQMLFYFVNNKMTKWRKKKYKILLVFLVDYVRYHLRLQYAT
jgi:hypothetical protein